MRRIEASADPDLRFEIDGSRISVSGLGEGATKSPRK